MAPGSSVFAPGGVAVGADGTVYVTNRSIFSGSGEVVRDSSPELSGSITKSEEIVACPCRPRTRVWWSPAMVLKESSWKSDDARP